MPQRWGAVRLQLECIIGGFQFEVVQATITFELNSIPTAMVTLAAGRNVKTLEPAAAHGKLGAIQSRDSFELYFVPQSLGEMGGAPNAWHEAMIFDGMVVGTGWQRSTHGASFTIYAQHWLADLHYSSSISGASHPGNPADFTYAAGYVPLGGQGAGGTALQWVPHAAIQDNFTEGALEEDLWEGVLKKWMTQLSKEEPVDDRLGDTIANKAALNALAKIKSEKMGMQLTKGDDANAIGNAVVWALNKSMARVDVNNTLWGKLVGEWSPQYWFAIVPRVTDAYVVPFTGALRGAEGEPSQWADINAGDYVQCDLYAGMQQILRAVGIAFPISFAAGGNTNPGEHRALRRGLAGLFKSGEKRGLVLIKDAPLWLSDAAQDYKYSGGSCGILPNSLPIRSAYTVVDEGPAQDPKNKAEDNQEDWKNILDAYAQQWFMLEMLKGRHGELSGRLRFDIAPGSQVRIEGGRDPFVAADQLGLPFFASVTRVTTVINAEKQQAGTSFSLAHIRNENENKSDETSIERPPLYKEGWVGKSLIDDYLPNA